MIFAIVAISFFLWEIRNIFLWVSIWQIKEYRLDRFRAHVFETNQGRALLLSPTILIVWILLALYGISVFFDGFSNVYQIAVELLIICEGMYTLYLFKNRQLKRPKITAKSLAVIALSLSFISVLYNFSLLDTVVWFLILKLVTPIVVSLCIFFFAFPTEIYIDMMVNKAAGKIKSRKDLLTIAISGSYGKSSTKEYLSHMLSEKFSVVATPLSHNTPIGIAKTILNNISNTTQILIVEMGAYKKGEIRELCYMVKPQISITTSISDQHLSLFGNMENVFTTESELINTLPYRSLSLFNGNTAAVKLYEKTTKRKILYKVVGSLKESGNIKAYKVKQERWGITFSVMIGKEKLHFHTSLLGEHNVENILPAIYLGYRLGLTTNQLKKGVASLSPLPKTMVKVKLNTDAVGIDDTFNASPESVLAGAGYIKLYKRRKLFVLSPLIELGKHAGERHRMLGKSLGFCDYLFVTNGNFISEIKKGIQESRGKCQIITGSLQEIANQVSKLARREDVVLFEGKEAGIVLSKLL